MDTHQRLDCQILERDLFRCSRIYKFDQRLAIGFGVIALDIHFERERWPCTRDMPAIPVTQFDLQEWHG